MKLVGLLLVIVAGGLMGVLASLQLNQRVKALTLTEELLSFLNTRIAYTAAPVGTLLQEAAKQTRFAPLSCLKAIQTALKTEPLPQAWQKGIRENGQRDGLNREDAALLLRIGAELGRTDLTGQSAHLALAHRQIEDQLREARSRMTVKGKLYRTLGLASGAAVALLLL